MSQIVKRVLFGLGVACLASAEKYFDANLRQATDKPKAELFKSMHKRLREGKELDLEMKKLEDFNHVIDMWIGDDEVPYTLIPDTNMNELHVLGEGCSGCYNTNDHYFVPSGEPIHKEVVTSIV